MPARAASPLASPKMVPGKLVQLAIDLAIPAPEKKLKRLIGQVLDLVLLSIQNLRVRLTIVLDDRVAAKNDSTGRHIGSSATIAEGVDELVDGKIRIDCDNLPSSRTVRSRDG